MELAFARKEGQELGGLVSEARTGKRFPLELPIKIHKADEAGQASGVTGNLSAAGVYIRADAALEVGWDDRVGLDDRWRLSQRQVSRRGPRHVQERACRGL